MQCKATQYNSSQRRTMYINIEQRQAMPSNTDNVIQRKATHINANHAQLNAQQKQSDVKQRNIMQSSAKQCETIQSKAKHGHSKQHQRTAAQCDAIVKQCDCNAMQRRKSQRDAKHN
eukprot:6419989-Pyramimonas_sp.AAC.1